MGRPIGAAWRPLSIDEDPTPGDPQRVTGEVNHLNSVATTILKQISALKKIAGDDSDPLIGKYAEKIRESAGGLVDTLQKVHERYTKVASALGGWEPDLVTAQAMSLKALNEAEGPYRQLQVLNGPTASAPQTSSPTQQQQQAAAHHKAAVGKAQDQLNGAINDLHKATQFRDDRANYWAGKIKSASDDGLKDSWWDSFKDFIGKWAWLIKDICTVLEVVGAILAIIALFATGVGWLLMVAFIVTAVALLGRTLLAATGNGSWLDVALDAVALLTLGLSGGLSGVGALVGRAGRTMEEAVTVGDKIVEEARAASLTGKAIGFLGKGTAIAKNLAETVGKIPGLSFVSGLFSKGAAFTEGASEFLGDMQDVLRPMATDMVKGLEEKDAALRAVKGGEDLANDVVKMKVLTNAFHDSPEIMNLAAKFGTQFNTARGLILGGALESAGGIALAGAPVYGPGEFGAEDPALKAPWDFKWFDATDEAMTAAVPDSAIHAIGQAFKVDPALQSFTYSPALIP
ncbi:MAG: hypothetical protein ACRDNW_07505 [Trebonia sp.]